MNLISRLLVAPYLVAIAACSPPSLTEYTPVVDTFNEDMGSFENDLIQCRSVASEAKVKYDQQASKAVLTNVLVGAVVGAAVGSAVGSGTGMQRDYTRMGAASGVAAGAGASTNEQLIARYGPNKIVDRCMAGRGYTILNDIGAGTN